MPTPVLAAPVDDKIQLLRARPTGMDEATWRAERRKVAEELGETRSKKSADALIEVVETERYDSVLTVAIQGLAKQGDTRALPALQKVYADRSIDTFVREEAKKAIEALGGKPTDDARLTGATAGPAGTADTAGSGPQIGTMGAASVADEQELADLEADKKFPENLRARERRVAFVLGSLDLSVNTLVNEQPILADAGIGSLARYVDEREKWGFWVDAGLRGAVRNGDITSTPDMGGDDGGNTLFFGQSLNVASDIHVYFGPTDFHAFAGLGVSERVTSIQIADVDDVDLSSTSETRFTVDLVPAAGVGWGRFLNAGSDLLVDAIVHALEDENILAREIDAETRQKIRDALYRRSNTFSTYPRLAAVLAILQNGGYFARRPSARVIHRLRSVLEDPSYLRRNKGIQARAGFLYGAPLLQGDFVDRGDGLGAPFVQFIAGFQLSRERQIEADTRFWYDVISDPGFTADAGATYTRFFHTEFDDYRGQWFTGVRGGASQRTFSADIDPRIGFRAIGLAGYAYGFRRASEVRVSGSAGVDSGGFVLNVGLGFTLGLFDTSVYNPREGGRGRARGKRGAGKASIGAEAEAEAGE